VRIPPPPGIVFINADRDDLGVARELSTLLATQRIESYVPILDGSPEKVRRNLEENLKECDGLVLVYGAAEPFWVQEQLRHRKKIFSQRERKILAQALYLGPPPEKPEPWELPEVIKLDGRHGATADTVREFIERLTTAEA
jgi:hypothetical protein